MTGNPLDPSWDAMKILSANAESVTRAAAMRVLDYLAAKEFL